METVGKCIKVKIYSSLCHLLYKFIAFREKNKLNILFTKLPWPGDNAWTIHYSSQAATRLPHTVRLHLVPFNADRPVGKLWIPVFIVFGLTRPGIEPGYTASVADARPTHQYGTTPE